MGRDTCVREGTAGKMASGRVGVLVCVTYVCNSIWAYSCIWDLRVRVRKVYVKEACVPLCVCMCVCGEGLGGCICLDFPQVLGLPGRTILAPIPFSPLTDLFKLSASAFPPFLCFMISIIPPHCPPSPRPPAVSINKVGVTPPLRRAVLNDRETISEPIKCLPKDCSWINGNPVGHPWTD